MTTPSEPDTVTIPTTTHDDTRIGGGRDARPPRVRGPRTWAVVAAWVVIALVAITVITIAIIEITVVAPVAETARRVTADIATDEDVALDHLVAQGLVPSQALQPRVSVIDDLVNKGLVPDEAWRPPLYSPEELDVLRLVRSGDLPPEAIEGEPWVTKQLVNRGLVPFETLVPVRSRSQDLG